MNCSAFLLRCAPLALCVFLPSCEGLDPAALGGGGGYRPAPYERPEIYRESRGPDYGRPDVYRGPDRHYSGDDRYRDDRYRDDRYRDDRYRNDRDRDDRYSRPSSGRPDERARSGNSRDEDYFGGPKAWYKAGYALGKKDRANHHSSDYRRHNTQFDRKTESQFAAGYRDGYSH